MKTFIFCIFILGLTSLCALTEATVPNNFDEVDAGSETNPYVIEDLGNLRWLSETEEVWGDSLTTVYFEQTADIDATETQVWNFGFGFKTIGRLDIFYLLEGETFYVHIPFFGSYEANNNTISNISIISDDFENGFTGLFGYLNSAVISNLNVVNISVNSEGENILGGLVGCAMGNSVINNCSAQGTITGGASAGGLVGMIRDGNITNSYASISVTGDIETAGGFIGNLSHSTVSNCYSQGIIEVQASNNYMKKGGLIGNILSSTISNCYSAVNIPNEQDTAGGISGTLIESTMSNCTWDSTIFPVEEASNNNYTSTITNCSGSSTEEMHTISTFTDLGWDFGNVWAISSSENSGYPFLRWQDNFTANANDEISKPIVKNSNYPNPFNPETTIFYELQESGSIDIEVYNVKGQLIKSLLSDNQTKGNHQVVWNGTNANNKQVASGIYLYKIKHNNNSTISKMLMVK